MALDVLPVRLAVDTNFRKRYELSARRPQTVSIYEAAVEGLIP